MSTADELAKLADLRERGLLSEPEFARLKDELLVPPDPRARRRAERRRRSEERRRRSRRALPIVILVMAAAGALLVWAVSSTSSPSSVITFSTSTTISTVTGPAAGPQSPAGGTPTQPPASGSPGSTSAVTTTTTPATTTAPAAFTLTQLSPTSSTEVWNGPRNPLSFFWSGQATFPVTAEYAAMSCAASVNCVNDQYSFSQNANPLVWPEALWCSSTGGGTPVTKTSMWNAWLVDASGSTTNQVRFSVTCSS